MQLVLILVLLMLTVLYATRSEEEVVEAPGPADDIDDTLAVDSVPVQDPAYREFMPAPMTLGEPAAVEPDDAGSDEVFVCGTWYQPIERGE